jgi:hypothetical protein
VTNTHENGGGDGAPAALLLRRARDAMDTALAHIADAPLGSQARDEVVQEAAALVDRLGRLQGLLCREGYLRARPASNPAGS